MADVQEITEALGNAVDNQRTAKLPTFSNNSKDSCTARQLIDRIEEIAAVNAAWNDAKKILELKCCLQADAKHAWESKLRTYKPPEGASLTQWVHYRRLFLKKFDPIGTATAISTPFADFKQKPSETVTQFSFRLDRHFRRLEETHQEETSLVTAAMLTKLGIPEANDATKRALHLLLGEAVTSGYRRLEGLLFTAGLSNDTIRVKIQEQNKAHDIDLATELAEEQELILERKKAEAVNAKAVAAINLQDDAEDRPHVNAVREEDVPSAETLTTYEPVDEADWEWLNSMRAARRMPPRPRPQFFRRSGNGNNGNGNNNGYNNSNRNNGNSNRFGNNNNDRRNMICRYKPCSKKGHGQAECYMRKRDNAPCVDAQGRPWKNQPKVNMVGNDEPASLNSYRIM